MSPALGLAGKVRLKAPPEVFAKYPFPLSAVNVAVLISPVSQLTAPALPKPTCVPLLVMVAPEAIVI